MKELELTVFCSRVGMYIYIKQNIIVIIFVYVCLSCKCAL